MIRTRDATFLNQVANHPSVRPWLGTDGVSYVDLGILLALDGAFALINDVGGFVFIPKGEGEYEFHTQFLPEGRGRRVFEASREAQRIVFGEDGAKAVHTYVPHPNRAARGLAIMSGFTQTGADDQNTYWTLTREAWEARHGGSLPTMKAPNL